ncbi:hypothetical protein DFA_02384 [Cavenderia fasciculata]|uniref:Uncharacterized protein n=1 Tax=Cavenderia fasciculata TaxID=261658 RepID=F4PZA8_CACFS|nr:uncharacterized protein DFA_02384 [Cavenderia fasciculata]EGG19137.1 hypothetical protein DFA_02384 [Cavenderia fasciculata]|eukprot:XP_004366770.1 hypothetical protein DFA_02384 [Cavenderia fasciculata]
MSILSLSNLVLLQIIREIQDNVDIICFMLTCKKLYQNSSLKRCVRFKGIEELIDIEKREISQRFIPSTINQFKLLSFKDILMNSINQQQLLIDCLIDPTIINNDTSNITTTMIKDYDFIPSIYSIPSIETLFINDQSEEKDPEEDRFPYNYDMDEEEEEEETVDLTSISLLPNLQRLFVRSYDLDIGKHESIKSLDLHVDELVHLSVLENKFASLTELCIKSRFIRSDKIHLLPSSLTSLTLGRLGVPPKKAFYSLTSLLTLDIDLDFDCQTEKQPFIDLKGLHNLESFKLDGNDYEQHICVDYTIKMTVPPSIKNLNTRLTCIKIHPQCTMPLLERLKVPQCLLLEKKIRLSSSPLLKKLVIDSCFDKMPANLIPSSLEHLSIDKFSSDANILDQVVFPPSLTYLSMKGTCIETVNRNRLPKSLIKLKQLINDPVLPPLPQHLKEIIWKSCNQFKNNKPLLVFPSSTNNNNNNNNNNNSYPPLLETLNLMDICGDFTINVPPITKYLSLQLKPFLAPDGIPFFSLGSKIDRSLMSQQSQQQQWLPINTTHLTCHLGEKTNDKKKLGFRLDEVINHTNVRYLSLSKWHRDIPFEFSIQRLDPDNNNVLVLERHTLQGGIITQRKSINQQKQYDSTYLYLDTSSSNPFKFNWSFDVLN